MCPAVEPRFTTWPRRRATMCGRIARVTLSNPFRFVSIMRSQSSGSPSWILDIPLARPRSEEHTSELQSRGHLVCRLLLEKKKQQHTQYYISRYKAQYT